MLKRFKKRKGSSSSRSPNLAREAHRSPSYPDVPMVQSMGQAQQQQQHHHQQQQQQHRQHPGHHPHQQMQQAPTSPTYDPSFNAHPDAMGHQMQMGDVQHFPQHAMANAEHIWRGFETASGEQLPVWLSDQTLGGVQFSQNGIDAFLLPNDYLPAPQIW